MELTAIYHRPESEYAYLYMDGQLHIRIRTKKEDIKRIVLHYGDPFIFIEDLYEATKEMDKVTTDDLFDYWQVSVSVRHARIQYLLSFISNILFLILCTSKSIFSDSVISFLAFLGVTSS